MKFNTCESIEAKQFQGDKTAILRNGTEPARYVNGNRDKLIRHVLRVEDVEKHKEKKPKLKINSNKQRYINKVYRHQAAVLSTENYI